MKIPPLSEPHLPYATRLPSIKLPSLIYPNRDEWSFNGNQQTMSGYCNTHIAQRKMLTDILLPPILPANSYSPPPSLPDSPPYSSCSSLSVSSLPSSPDSVPDTSFSHCHVPQHHLASTTTTTRVTKQGCSIQSLLNSGSELLALEREDQLNRSRKGSIAVQKKKIDKRKRASPAPYFNNRKQPPATATAAALVDDTRNTKGLRLFSKQVCDKVAERGITTYNEVADELAAEIQQKSTSPVDQKNIRRRVYDALNVLMAMDIITKDRKQIKWLGLHHHQQQQQQQQQQCYSTEQIMLEQEIQQEESRQKHLLASIEKSKHDLNTALEDFARLEKLVKRNQQQQIQTHIQTEQQTEAVHLPFFMISSNDSIHTHWSHSKEAVLYSNSNCTVHHDVDILAKLWPSTSNAPNVVS
ncbi:E2F/DP family winged-helix DNA-binding domain-containing protein [Parasitella parasitica]|nr:E2F/DP family winged-helix DNA-binding domain-containing protein [Parasitella parasitica]